MDLGRVRVWIWCGEENGLGAIKEDALMMAWLAQLALFCNELWIYAT